ncbi:MAG: hypothetical protein WC736_15570 [Gallionella sp.]|jgi:hypothetical protein
MLITDLKDERLNREMIAFATPETVVIHHDDAEWVALMRDSLRAALSRATVAEAIVSRITVEGMAKIISELPAAREYTLNISHALCVYLKGEK